MSSLKKRPLRRSWGKRRRGVYLLNSADEKLPSTPSFLRSSKSPDHPSTKTSVRSANNSYSLEDAENKVTKQQFSSNSSSNDSVQEDTRSLGSITDEEDFWGSISADERSVKLLSNNRKGSLALNQILLDIQNERIENEKSEQTEEYNEYADVDVKAIAAAISGRLQDDDTERDSDSSKLDSSSESSDVDDGSSDEEADEESDHEVFDFENHINKLVKRQTKSESDDDDSDSNGNESVNSEKVFKRAVEKAMKKIKRERAEEIVNSDQESTQTSRKESETEESPTSEDYSTSEGSGQEGMERDTDLEILDLVKEGIIINSKETKNDVNRDHVHSIYNHHLDDNVHVSSVTETGQNKGYQERGENHPGADEVHRQEKENEYKVNLAAPILEKSKVEDLRKPFSNYYVKELKQDLGMPLSDLEEALPSYRSTVATAFYPGENVMLGRVWWVEWWSKEDSRDRILSEYADKYYML